MSVHFNHQFTNSELLQIIGGIGLILFLIRNIFTFIIKLIIGGFILDTFKDLFKK